METDRTVDMASPAEGIVYIAAGRDYIEEACRSARSVAAAGGDLHTTVFADERFSSPHVDDVRLLADPGGDVGDSIVGPDLSPYDRTLFLDTDTHVREDLSGIFDLLDRFDIAAAHNPGSRTARKGYSPGDVPESFPQYNTGVILFADRPAVADCMSAWERIYREHRAETFRDLNQPAFRAALYRSDLQVATLPSEYNLRIRYQGSAGFLTDSPKIVHGRHPAGLARVGDAIAAEEGMRTYSQREWPISVTTRQPSLGYYLRTLPTEGTRPHTFRGRFLESIRKRGLRDTLARVGRDVKGALTSQ